MARRKHEGSAGCDLNMTPMIDVVFQLIIFFVVTLKMTKDVNPDILLEDGKHGEVLKPENMPPQTLEIEVAKNGWITIHNARLSKSALRGIIQRRFNTLGTFPVLIRADQRTKHEDVKAIMDICTAVGVWKIGFVAIHDHKEQMRH